MCEHPSSAPRLTRTQNVLLWIMQLLLVAAFVPTGLATLAAHPMMAEMFYKIGLGQWLRLLTGAIEIGAAVLLLVPRLTSVGAILLACTMAGAVLTHLFVIGGSPVEPLVLFMFSAVIAWGRRWRLASEASLSK